MRQCHGQTARVAFALFSAVLAISALPSPGLSQPEPADAADALPSKPSPPSILELRFTPTAYAQIALWVEDASGSFLTTLGLTEAVATRGVGNRPGASQMNSGFRWPYGRREGVLPVWARRRASAPGAQAFRRVIFQNRVSSGKPVEGYASRTSSRDASRDDYFCLSFDTSRSKRDALDAVSCASVFSSDKGRFITQADVAAKYAEPYEDVATLEGTLHALSLESLYPPRRDMQVCAPACDDHADVASYAHHVRQVMPDIDAVTMATPPGGEPKSVQFVVPDAWGPGEYRACLEINVEGDYNEHYDATRLPTPKSPPDRWDSWAVGYGYPYRGQPSVVYCVPFTLGEDAVTEQTTDDAEGSVATWDTAAAGYGELLGMDTMTDDPVGAPGSGADRLLLREDGYRLKAVVKPPRSCMRDATPSPVTELQLSQHSDELHAHQWATLSFNAAGDDVSVFRYEVRVSTSEITDAASFMRGEPAKNASLQAVELRVPTSPAQGERISVSFGGLIAETHYYVGIRAIDECAQAGEIAVAELDTPKRTFATVSPCFVATAAYGTPLAVEVGALRRLRDRYLASHAPGRAAIELYWQVGPKLAGVIAKHEALRVVSRALLAPVVFMARALSD